MTPLTLANAQSNMAKDREQRGSEGVAAGEAGVGGGGAEGGKPGVEGVGEGGVAGCERPCLELVEGDLDGEVETGVFAGKLSGDAGVDDGAGKFADGCQHDKLFLGIVGILMDVDGIADLTSECVEAACEGSSCGNPDFASGECLLSGDWENAGGVGELNKDCAVEVDGIGEKVVAARGGGDGHVGDDNIVATIKEALHGAGEICEAVEHNGAMMDGSDGAHEVVAEAGEGVGADGEGHGGEFDGYVEGVASGATVGEWGGAGCGALTDEEDGDERQDKEKDVEGEAGAGNGLKRAHGGGNQLAKSMESPIWKRRGLSG